MPRPPKENPKPSRRPSKQINWDLVDELLLAGCPGTEIAPHFDMHYQTFYDRVQIEKGVGFTEYSSQKKQKGESILRHAQYKKAIGATEKGDNTLLIWLGKTRLDQRETQEVAIAPETTKAMVTMMDQLAQLQEDRKQSKKANEVEVQPYPDFDDILDELRQVDNSSDLPPDFGKLK